MCLNCKWNKWAECTCEDENMTEEDVRKIEDGTYDETNCPFFVPYWAKEKHPYEYTDRT